jgi:hypothetical protein
LVVAATLLLSFALPAAAQAQVNDHFQNRLPLALGATGGDPTHAATIQGGEEYTANGTAKCQGVEMGNTLWWSIPRDVTGRVTITTEFSGPGFDTVLAVYRFNPAPMPNGSFIPPHPCNNNMHPFSRQARMRVTIDPNWEQVIQAGGCSNSLDCFSGPSGGLSVSLLRTPPNDDRNEAIGLTNGQTSSPVDTAGATVVDGERQECGLAPFDKTVWYSFTPTSTGTATFEVSGVNSVISVYRGSDTAPVQCFDDQRGGVETTSLSLGVDPVTYFIQVGGAGREQADDGDLTVRASFVDVDLDDDGENNDADCAPTDGARTHLKAEVINNDVDENCDGHPAYDRDDDKQLAPPLGDDCNDNVKRIHRGARDIRGNRVNEDCVGGPAPFLKASSSVFWRWVPAGSSVRLTRLYVEDVRPKTRIQVRCKGSGCPIRKWSRTQKRRRPRSRCSSSSRARSCRPASRST